MLSNKPQPIGLNDLISKIKEEILEDQEITTRLFIIGKVELEISFTIERNLSGGINLQVVQSGTEKTMMEAQKIKVTLEPIVTLEEIRTSLLPEQKNKAKEVFFREFRQS